VPFAFILLGLGALAAGIGHVVSALIA